MKFKEFDPKLINDDNKIFLIVSDDKQSYCSMYLNDKKELTFAYRDERGLVESTTNELVQDLRFIKFFDENKNIRLYGQLLYDIFDKKIDCFYKDDKIDEFIKEAYNIYQEHVN